MVTKKTKPLPPEAFSTGGFFTQKQLKDLGVPKKSRTPHAKPKSKKGTK